MNISEIFIRRPIATSLLMAGIALMGVIAYTGLPVSDLPAVDYPTVQVQASLPGGDPATMGSTVASPLERQFTTIAGVDEMTSSSSAGTTSITLSFDLDRNVDSAVVDVQTAIAAAMPLLPSTLTSPPSFRKQNPADQPILMLNLTSSTLSMAAVDEFAENVLAPRISTVEGVSQVQVQGAQKYAVRVQLDPDRMRAQKVGMNEVDQALANWNANEPTGQLFGHDSTYTITANGLLQRPDGNILQTADKFKSLVITYVDGRPVRLDEVANVADSVETVTQAAWLYTKQGRQRAITLQVQKQPGTNVIQVTDAVRKVLPSLQAQLPPSVHLSIRQDRSRTIRQAFGDIQITMLITLALVVGVIYLFLHNWSATLIPALALPFSILGTFAVMKMLGYSLDNLSMMALILSIGFVVDDAIVMLENIVRHMEAGEQPLEAALKGSREIGFTILTMTTSLAAVFIPILFMAGILGRLFREFAVTITTAVLISGIVSVTLTPMLCSRFLKVVHREGRLRRPHGPRLRRPAARLRLEPRPHPAPPSGDARRVRRGAVDDAAHVRRRAQGVHSRFGQRFPVRQPARGTGHVVLRGGRRHREDHRPAESRSQHRRDDGEHRWRQRQRHEHQPDQRPADAARDADAQRRAGGAAPATDSRAVPRHPRHGQRAAGPADRRLPRRQHLQPHGAEPEHRRNLRMDAAADGRHQPAARGDRRRRPTSSRAAPAWIWSSTATRPPQSA